MSAFGTLRHFLGNMARAVQLLAEIRDGIANLTDVTDRRLKAIEKAVAEGQRPHSEQGRPGPASQAANQAPRPGGSRFFPR